MGGTELPGFEQYIYEIPTVGKSVLQVTVYRYYSCYRYSQVLFQYKYSCTVRS